MSGSGSHVVASATTTLPVVVNTGSKLVAIDTGLGLGMFEQSKGAVGQYHGNLKAAGIDASQIDTVIISHFHGDHNQRPGRRRQRAGVP
jgi:glyoxylase-like metal-dependent hydrolase (beta-lactamase superfamily II)